MADAVLTLGAPKGNRGRRGENRLELAGQGGPSGKPRGDTASEAPRANRRQKSKRANARAGRRDLQQGRGLVSVNALSRTRGKLVYWTVFAGVTALFAAVFLFPMFWGVTGALRSVRELGLNHPTLVPQHVHFSNYSTAWRQLQLGMYFENTVVQAGGAWAFEIVVLTLAAFALSRMRPRFGRVVFGGILASLMLPSYALVVPKYLVAESLPFIHVSLLNSPLGIWLPAAANAFNLYLLKRFFDQIPDDMMEAAEIDGAGPLRKLWSIVVPMARPVLAVTSIFAFVAVWQDFLWPLLVFSSNTNEAPISVALVSLSTGTPLDILLAAMVIASIPMVLVFLLLQRHIVAGLMAGASTG